MHGALRSHPRSICAPHGLVETGVGWLGWLALLVLCALITSSASVHVAADECRDFI